MSDAAGRPGETPHPPATAEFGHVEPGGPSHRYEATGPIVVTKFSVGPFDNNVYVLRCADTGRTLIVDGAADADRILREVSGSEVVAIVQTHGHPDHVQALPALVEALRVPVYASPGDAGKMPVPTKPLSGGERLQVGSFEVSVLFTPGHTAGGLCFVADGYLFSGDTLFPAGPGRVTTPEGFRAIMGALDRLFELPDETRVCPGHGLDTFIGRERQYLETWRARGW